MPRPRRARWRVQRCSAKTNMYAQVYIALTAGGPQGPCRGRRRHRCARSSSAIPGKLLLADPQLGPLTAKEDLMLTTRSGLSPFERLLTLFTRVRPGEGRSALLFVLHAFLLLFSYQVVKALREAFMLAKFSAEVRSYAVAVTALVADAAGPALRRRAPPARRRAAAARRDDLLRRQHAGVRGRRVVGRRPSPSCSSSGPASTASWSSPSCGRSRPTRST